MQSLNPYTGKIVGEYNEYTIAEVDEIIGKVDIVFQSWRHTGFEQRAVFMKNLQAKLLEKKEELATVIVSEMGKVKREAIGEVEK